MKKIEERRRELLTNYKLSWAEIFKRNIDYMPFLVNAPTEEECAAM